ncbi:MAG TPA: hypothetical protein VK806_05135 [Bacteroidia bacterium]|nr:hypothetical protein [Bacteroidia bacterium]
MYISGIVAAFLIALLISLIFSVGFKHNGPWGTIWLFFVVIFLLLWAGQLWLIPFGPNISGTSWLSLLLLGLIFAFALVAPSISKPNKQKDDVVAPVITTIGTFFWCLIILLLLAIASGYLITPMVKV